MFLHGLAFSFPAWRPHFSLLDTPLANEMMILRWLHLIFGVIWIGLLYFFNLVLTPAMKEVNPAARVKIYPALMSRAMGWLRMLSSTRCSSPPKEFSTVRGYASSELFSS